ncbi:hypothetical protein DFH09DRAFT_1076810 [Mycena vulgaris]|nr:hypothetical protein DFH09DRAFT_1076810 [Mycena vulgaris]
MFDALYHLEKRVIPNGVWKNSVGRCLYAYVTILPAHQEQGESTRKIVLACVSNSIHGVITSTADADLYAWMQVRTTCKGGSPSHSTKCKTAVAVHVRLQYGGRVQLENCDSVVEAIGTSRCTDVERTRRDCIVVMDSTLESTAVKKGRGHAHNAKRKIVWERLEKSDVLKVDGQPEKQKGRGRWELEEKRDLEGRETRWQMLRDG